MNQTDPQIMNTDLTAVANERQTMNGKPVIYRDAKTVLTTEAIAFQEKGLCDGLTLNLGDACAYECAFCYVPTQMRKLVYNILADRAHEDVVIRRRNAISILRDQLTNRYGNPRYTDPNDRRVVYSSTLVDICANMELVKETAEACNLIFELTHWQIRLLTKSNLLPQFVALIPQKWHARLIMGVSTGTFDDRVARAFERGTPLVSKRIQSLHWLQNNGFRTFGMICPSLPQDDYLAFAKLAAETIRVDRCEDVWAEVINVRGASFTNTHAGLMNAGLLDEAARLAAVSVQAGDTPAQKLQKHAAWEAYARATFMAHAQFVPNAKLKFLQYVTHNTCGWWAGQEERGAVLLGEAAKLKR